ncbi:ATP-binding protein [Marinomonas transparens]|nr:ATP-binding protein [Marinomonas transparens]
MKAILITACGYFLFGLLGLLAVLPPSHMATIWPAAGFALGMVLIFPVKWVLLGVFFGSLAANGFYAWLIHSTSYFSVTFFFSAVGAVLQFLVAGWLVDRLIDKSSSIRHVSNVLRLLLLIVPLSALVYSSVASLSLAFSGDITLSFFAFHWLTWWTAVVLGCLFITPWFVVLFPHYFGGDSRSKYLIFSLFVVLVCSILLSLWVGDFERRKQQEEFRNNAELLRTSLSGRVRSAEDILYGIVGLVRGSNQVDAVEFQRYADSVMYHDSSIQALSLNLAVSGAELGKLEHFIENNYPSFDFFIKQHNSAGELVAVMPRDLHVVVSYIAPFEENKSAIGFDVYSQVDRRYAIDQAIERNRAYPTGPINLVQNSVGVLLFLPLLDHDNITFLGVATALIQMEELSKRIVHRGLLPNTELYLIDMGREAVGPKLLASSADARLSTDALLSGLDRSIFGNSVTYDVEVGAHQWNLIQVSENVFFRQPWSVYLVVTSVLLVASLLSWFLLLINNYTAEVERQVARRTQDLQLANKSLKESELAHSKAKLEAERANRAKSEFLANMSHEIRTPLNGVIGCLSLLINTGLRSEQSNLARLSQQSAESLLDIINDLLDLSKIEVGSFVLDKHSFDLRALIEEIALFFSAKSENKKIALYIPTSATPQIRLLADRLRLKQVLVNLLGNAIKFTREGEVSLRIVVDPLDENTVILRFTITDTGVGISQASQDQLFQRFRQGDGSTTRQFGGTGLGLAISKDIVDAMGGEIGFSSGEGKGATFWFSVPLAFDPTFALSEEKPHGDLRALVIYQDNTGRDYITSLLEMMGVSFQSYETISQVLLDSPLAADCLLLDEQVVTSSLIDDLDKLERLCQAQEIKQILLKGRSDVSFNSDRYFAFLTKPIFYQSLESVLDSMVTLPLGEKVMKESGAENKSEERPAFNAKILLVEDNVTNQIVARGLLNLYGIDVVVAEHGQKAVELAATTKFDLIFMDCQMPVMDGYEATRQIRKMTNSQTPADVVIVALSANAMKGDDDICFAAGMNDHMGKPISQQKLTAMLTKWLPY